MRPMWVSLGCSGEQVGSQLNLLPMLFVSRLGDSPSGSLGAVRGFLGWFRGGIFWSFAH